MPKLRVAFQAALLVLAVAWVFFPALSGGWLSDDKLEVTGNPDVRETDGLARIWLGADSTDYFPLKGTVQWAEWRLWGDWAAGYHGVSIALHAVSALLLWRLLRRLGARWAWLGALWFAVHPLVVE